MDDGIWVCLALGNAMRASKKKRAARFFRKRRPQGHRRGDAGGCMFTKKFEPVLFAGSAIHKFNTYTHCSENHNASEYHLDGSQLPAMEFQHDALQSKESQALPRFLQLSK